MTQLEKIEHLDLQAWVDQAPREQRTFREAVHSVLWAISTSTALRSKMIMKGGLLMAIRYESSRFTSDVDFSTQQKYSKAAEAELLPELDAQLEAANDALGYDTMCRRQGTKVTPAKEDGHYQTLQVKIGYAQRSKPAQVERLRRGQMPNVVRIDYSYNEAIYDTEILGLGEGEELQAYSFLNLIAEKMRSVLQQIHRDRLRRQDIYDLNLLLTTGEEMTSHEKKCLLDLVIASCRAREIEPTKDSFASTEIKEWTRKGYEDLAAEIEGELPDFDETYAVVQSFYEALPWDAK